jgi:class 3 adenylate cyclase
MKCLNCSYPNPDDAKFCQNCGKPLERPCPNCGTHNTLDARFCKNCGYALQHSSSQPASALDNPATISQNQSALEKVRQTTHTTGERRIVTVLFADVVDSTSLAERMDPEDWTSIMNRAFDLLTPVITRYEGTIARLMGDALLAFFGAPVAHEDDPLRAGYAALDLIKAAGEYSEELRKQFGIDFGVRVGINTGPVVVGDVGSNLAYEYTAMGDAVNLAARMQAAAKPMTVLITENTHRLMGNSFEFIDLGLISIRGKSEPVHVFELGAPTNKVLRLRSSSGIGSTLVGREHELATLSRLAQAVRSGLGRAVLVLGEPGIGKSRLISEWKLRLQNSPAAKDSELWWVEGRCLSYGQGIAYHLLVDLLRSILAINPGVSGASAQAALKNLCTDLLDEQQNSVYPYLGHLLSLPMEESALEQVRALDPQALQAQYLNSLRSLITAMSARKALYIILDDIHWADPSSVDLLIRLLPLVAEERILFCLISRPELDTPGWRLVMTLRQQMGASLTEISLRALSESESNQLVSNLLDSSNLPKPVYNIIMNKTEGNPLFVEEVIRMLVDRRLLERDGDGWRFARDIESVDIPANLQSLLLARIDRLPEEARQTLRIASVIGRQFSARVLEEVLKRQGIEAGQ